MVFDHDCIIDCLRDFVQKEIQELTAAVNDPGPTLLSGIEKDNKNGRP